MNHCTRYHEKVHACYVCALRGRRRIANHFYLWRDRQGEVHPRGVMKFCDTCVLHARRLTYADVARRYPPHFRYRDEQGVEVVQRGVCQ